MAAMRPAEADQILSAQRADVHVRQLLALEPIADLVAAAVLVDDEPIAVWRSSSDVDGTTAARRRGACCRREVPASSYLFFENEPLDSIAQAGLKQNLAPKDL